jgi:hypothetical protein
MYTSLSKSNGWKGKGGLEIVGLLLKEKWTDVGRQKLKCPHPEIPRLH